MSKVINFGSGKSVWKTASGDKWEIKGSFIADALYFMYNGNVTYKLQVSSLKNIVGVSGAKYGVGYGYLLYPNYFFANKVITLTFVSTEDNGTEEFAIPYPYINSATYQVFRVHSVENSKIIPKISIDEVNNKVIVERDDSSGEEVKIHIFMARQ